jgi:glucose-6-phosphate 1-epimerase
MNAKHGIPGYVEVKAGRGGLPTVVLTHACGSTAEIVLFGAVITSWKQPSGDEVLYVRPDAVFDKSKPISGGVPHCFPQFGPGKMQQHGFARNLDWEIAATSADPQPDDREPEVQLVLTDNDYTRAMWPHAFKVVYSVTLHGDILKTDMRVVNTGSDTFDFSAALHTYFEVADIHKAQVRGLKGLTYLDKTVDANNPPSATETRDAISFTGPVDSVYLKAKDHVELDVGTGAAVAITSNNWGDVVVWSPWTSMEACYKEFCCVENAQFSTPIVLKAGEFWRAQAEFAVVDL